MVDEFFGLEKKIHEYFGYNESWVVLPLVDHREYYWRLDGEEMGGEVIYHENPLTDDILAKGHEYAASVYTQRFLPKWVYRTEEYTLICMDTHVDDNKYLGVFDNSKEMTLEC